MTDVKEIKVPDIGDFSNVDVIEVSVKPGQTIEKEDTLIVLETDKAALDVPAPMAGVVKEVKVKKGDKVSEGDIILTVQSIDAIETIEKEAETKKQPVKEFTGGEEDQQAVLDKKKSEGKVPSGEQPSKSISKIETLKLPDLGSEGIISVIEWQFKPGDHINREDSIITLEGDKASMDVPSPYTGKLIKQLVKVGDKVESGQEVAEIETMEVEFQSKPKVEQSQKPVEPPREPTATLKKEERVQSRERSSQEVHAGPSVRRLANQLGVDLVQVKGSGRKGRILAHDVHRFVKQSLQQGTPSLGIEPIPETDFTKWGQVEIKPLNRIKKLTAKNLHRNWVNIPHVTHFDEADITELEQFRQDNKASAKDMGINLTPLAFIMKAVVSSLKAYPQFNSSLSSDGSDLIYKNYIHLGVAVDTKDGLVVPVVRDVDTKGVFAIAKELGELSQKARDGQLKIQDMQGGCFSISSLGGIGGQQFTPIINAPEVAILGVSKSMMKPIYQDNQFVPKLMLPLALSYDHRVIDGAQAARFVKHLCIQLADIRKLLL